MKRFVKGQKVYYHLGIINIDGITGTPNNGRGYFLFSFLGLAVIKNMAGRIVFVRKSNLSLLLKNDKWRNAALEETKDSDDLLHRELYAWNLLEQVRNEMLLSDYHLSKHFTSHSEC